MNMQRRRLRLESLEARALLHAAPISLLSIAPDHESYLVTDELETIAVPILDEGDSSRWSPELYGDFTNDGVDDVLGRLDNGDWWLQVNDGTQLFTIPFRQGLALSETAEVIDSVDINGDDRLDVVSLDRTNGDIWVSLNTVNGLSNQVWGTLSDADPDHVFIGDFNGDGNVDVLASGANEDWWLAQNTGNSLDVQGWGGFRDFDWVDVLSGDFDGDMTDDVAARAPDNTWWVWRGGEDRMQPAQFWGHWKMRDEWTDVAAEDFTNDGRTDLIGRTDDGRLWVSTSIGTRFQTWTWSRGWVDRAEWSRITHIDFNFDGLTDQIGKAKDDTWWYALNVDGQTFNNYFWLEAAPTEFTVVSELFTRAPAVDVTEALPSGGTDVSDVEVSVTLNENDQIVLDGPGIAIIALELASESGSLIPGDSDPDPFEILLSNTEMNWSVGNITSPPQSLDGGLIVNVGWDVTSDAQDLEVSYGVDAVLRTATVFEPLSNVPMPTLGTPEETNGIYYGTIPTSRIQFPDL